MTERERERDRERGGEGERERGRERERETETETERKYTIPKINNRVTQGNPGKKTTTKNTAVSDDL